jgi:purine-binding chemotaxis protein CheW
VPRERRAVLCRIGGLRCALPIQQVVETFRPLPVEHVRGAPAFVSGVTIHRGAAVPVVDGRRLFGTASDQPPARFVALRAGDRHVALAVDEVVGIAALPDGAELPPLLSGAAEGVAAILAADGELWHVLAAGHLVPEAAWEAIERGGRG